MYLWFLGYILSQHHIAYVIQKYNLFLDPQKAKRIKFKKAKGKGGKKLKINIVHISTRVKTPKDNSVNERFNRTLKEEFMQVDEYFEPYLTESDLTEANKRLTEWLIFYNFIRPHQALNYKTPIEWYNESCKLKQVLPMYPTLTTP